MAKKHKYENLTNHFLELIGGKENITFFTHCVTRLRINVKDKGLVDNESMEQMEGVMGIQWSGEQYQIIIGSGVDTVYNELCEKYQLAKEEAVNEKIDSDVKKTLTLKTMFPTLLDTLTAILAPIIPAIVACGLLQGVLYSIQSFGWIDPAGETYVFFFN